MSFPCGPIVFFPPCPPNCPDVPVYTFENDNLVGQGVFHQNVSNTIGFYGLTNTDGAIDISLDATNNVINLDLNPTLLAGTFPDATTTSKGKVELSIDAEAIAKSSTTVVLTPSNLAALGATTTFAGFVELATEAETAAYISTTLAVTPAGLGAAIGNIVRMDVVNGTADDFAIQLLGATFQMYDGSANMTFNVTGLRLTAAPLTLATGANLNFNGGKIQIAGVDIPADSFVITDSAAGVVTSELLASYFGPHNPTEDWVNTAYIPNRSFDPATVTLPDLATAVLTLLNDLATVKKPNMI